MDIRFIAFSIACTLTATTAAAQVITGGGINTASSNQRLEADFTLYKSSQAATDAQQDAERTELAEQVNTLRTTVETLQSALAALVVQVQSQTTNTTTTAPAPEGLDTDALPIARMGNGEVSATCPAGYRFTGVYDVPATAHDYACTVTMLANGVRKTCTVQAPVQATAYCAR